MSEGPRLDSFTVAAILAATDENDNGGSSMAISREHKRRNGLKGGARVAADVIEAYQSPHGWTMAGDGSWQPPAGGGYGSVYAGASTKAVPEAWKCRHYHKEYTLPNGLIMQASSMTGTVKRRHKTPQFGLYLDSGWLSLADWRTEFIYWPDYGVPRNPRVAAEAITEAYTRITEGWLVETGCIGGHGRTGTVLACMNVLAGETDPEAAMRYVWKRYCKEAIESKAQMEFVRWFASKCS